MVYLLPQVPISSIAVSYPASPLGALSETVMYSALVASAPNQKCSFRCLIGAPRLGDKRLQGFEIPRASRDLVADYETRRAGDVQRLPKLVVLFQHASDGFILHVRFHASDIETDGPGGFQHLGLIHMAAHLIKRTMKVDVFALLVGRKRRLGGERRVCPEDGKFLVDDPQLRIGRLGLRHRRRHYAALR